MRRPELTPARSRSRRAHHADATRRRLIGGSRLSAARATSTRRKEGKKASRARKTNLRALRLPGYHA